MTDKVKGKTLSRQQELMRGFHFNQAALEANRRGQITEQQRKWVLKREHWYWNLFLFLLGIGLSIIFVAIIVGVILHSLQENSDGLWIAIFLLSPLFLAVAIILPLTIWNYAPRFLMYRDLQAGEIQAVQGLAIVNINERSPSSLTVNKLQLKAPRSGLLRIKHLEPHIVYYLPRSKMVVSVEVVEEL